MNFYAKVLLSIIISFVVVAVVMPFLIKFLRKKKMGQNILSFVDMHSSKSGTPTMGGVSFMIVIFVVGLIFAKNSKLVLMSLVVSLAYALIGFLDDYIKFKMHRNLGLRPYQKIISQFVVAVSVAIFVYLNPSLVGSKVLVPFSFICLDLGWGIIPFVVLIFLATTNSVNLTDGLDGLAGTTTIAYYAGLVLVLLIQIENSCVPNMAEAQNMVMLSGAAIGALFGFLLYNSHPAKIFMGDTGSLGLGGLVASVSIFSRNSLYIPILGIMFVASSVSVILQVVYFKATKGKRIFLMAPLHHHFEKKGHSETKIVAWYGIITLMVGLVCAFILLCFA